MGLAVWVDVSGAFSLEVVRIAADRIAGVKIHSADLDNPVVFEGVKGLSVPVAIGCGGTPLIDLFEVLDALGPDCPLILMHGYQAFPKLAGAPGGPPVRGVQVDELELWRIRQLSEVFPNARIGLADHLAGDDPMAVEAPAIAVALGATVIEKHVTLHRSEQREDYYSSLEPQEFGRMVENIRKIAAAVGFDRREMGEGERGYQCEMKRTPLSSRDLPSEKLLKVADIELRRDGNYQTAARWRRLINRRVSRTLKQGERLTEALVHKTIGVFCNARLSSSRLPEKALLPFFEEYTTLGYLLKRLVAYPGEIGQVVLATTIEPEDDALEAIARSLSVPSFRGETEDVMGRMVQTAQAFDWDVLVRVTGDDQFISCEYIEKALHYHLSNSLDYTRVEGLPVGMACEIIDVPTLQRIHRVVLNRNQTEHLTWYLDSEWVCRNGIVQAEPEHRFGNFRVTLDYKQDYELMREVADRCHAGQDEFYIGIDQIIQALNELNPEWIQQEELWPLRRDEVDTKLIYDYIS
jgi:N,N'-diacetyllegionaminate synthase